MLRRTSGRCLNLLSRRTASAGEDAGDDEETTEAAAAAAAADGGGGTPPSPSHGGGGGGGGGTQAVGPSPRSASHVAAHGDALFVYGGYCKYAGDGDGDDGDVEKGVTHSDLWRLDLRTWCWEKQKKKGLAPGPRAGATSATHLAKKRAVLFGGVVDHEVRKGEVIISEFFSDAYCMSLENGRWFPVTLYADKSDASGAVPGASARGAGGGGARRARRERQRKL